MVQPSPELPNWLPKAAWVEWCEHRRQIKKPMSDLAAAKTIAGLAKLVAGGEDPTDLIDRAIANGWQGIFSAKGRSTPSKRPSSNWALNDDDPLFSTARQEWPN